MNTDEPSCPTLRAWGQAVPGGLITVGYPAAGITDTNVISGRCFRGQPFAKFERI